jgi:hypothetical protein
VLRVEDTLVAAVQAGEVGLKTAAQRLQARVGLNGPPVTHHADQQRLGTRFGRGLVTPGNDVAGKLAALVQAAPYLLFAGQRGFAGAQLAHRTPFVGR